MKVFLFVVLAVSVLSCQAPNEKKIPVIDGLVRNYTAQSVVLYCNNFKAEVIDTIKISEEGIFNVCQESIQKVGFYYLQLENGEKISLFLKPNDFVQFSFDATHVKASCNCKNSSFISAIWALESNTQRFSEELELITNRFKNGIVLSKDEALYQDLYHLKDSLVQHYRSNSLKIVKGIQNPILTYLMLNQKSGNVSLFSLEKDLKLFLNNSEQLMKDTSLSELFFAYDQQVMKAYAIIRSGQRYGKGGVLPKLHVKTKWNEELALDKIGGKLIHVVFWTAENDYNQEKILEIKRLMRRYGTSGLKTLMLAYQTDTKKWESGIKSFRLPYWHMIDTSGVQSPDIQELGLRSLPCNMLVANDGVIVDREVWGNKLADSVKNYLKNN